MPTYRLLFSCLILTCIFFASSCSKDGCSELNCLNGAICIETANGPQCECLPGYSGETCQNFNPCEALNCENDGICLTDSNGDAYCSCPSGYFGEQCEFYDECLTIACENGTCTTDGAGNLFCDCDPGYTGPSCELFDPCFSLDCQNGGSCIINPSGQAVCLCPTGFSGLTCDPIAEAWINTYTFSSASTCIEDYEDCPLNLILNPENLSQFQLWCVDEMILVGDAFSETSFGLIANQSVLGIQVSDTFTGLYDSETNTFTINFSGFNSAGSFEECTLIFSTN